MMRILSYKLIDINTLSGLEENVKSLELQIDAAKNFIKEIEKGNLSIDLKNSIGANEDSLALSLLNMRDQMQKIALEEKQRNWVTEGLARFVEILRSKNDNLNELADTITSSIIKYMDANQGSLYVINEDDLSDIHLELMSSYAYSRKKYLKQRISIGEGLTGQSVLEKATLFMTDIPGDYMKITSGLGESLPRNLLIVPLMLNERVYGVIEMASFNIFKNHQVEFIERLAESIASTISTARINQNTRKLLSETQVQAEQMRSQEEEMRQNMEELTSTQDEMQRILLEVQRSEKDIGELINVSADSIMTIDREYKVVRYNKVFLSTFEALSLKPGKGFDIMSIFSKEEQKTKVQLYKRVFNGEVIDILDELKTENGNYHYSVRHAPLRDADGRISTISIFARDITELIKSKEKAEALALDSQQKNEELKAQEEELRQNMEELQATQDAMISKQAEVDAARIENDRIRQEEAERALKVGEMQKKTMLSATLKLKAKVNELQQVKSEMEKLTEAETQRGLKIAEMQKQAMNKIILRLKSTEQELTSLKSRIKVKQSINNN